MITFNTDHLSTVHQQAHTSRDLLIELDIVDNIPSKSAWLNMFAQALNYRDWGELNHFSASFATSLCFHVLTPENLPAIAKRLREQIGEFRATIDTIEAILLSVATPEEKVLNGVSDSFCINGPNAITLVFEPDPFYAKPLLEWLLAYGKVWLTISYIEDRYLAQMKLNRRGLSRAEAKANHFDVYPKSGQRVPDILNALESDRFVEFSELKDSARITDNGIQLIIELITDDYCPNWQKWWRELRNLIKAEPYMDLKDDWIGYVIFYAEGRSPSEYINCYAPQYSKNPFTAILEKGYQSLTSHSKLPLHPTGKFVHIAPKLYLGVAHQSYKCRDLNLEIKGPDWLRIPEYELKRLLPNRRYIGLSGDMIGIISELPDSISQFDVEFIWTSSNKGFPVIEQRITFLLDAGTNESENWLYSTETGVNSKHCTHAFSSYSALTHGEKLTTEELMELPRVKGPMSKLEIIEAGKRIRIEDVLHLALSNQFDIHF